MMIKNPNFSRRDMLGGLLAVAGGTSLSPATRAWAQNTQSLRSFAGETIAVNLVKSPRGDLLQRYEAEFTELTGINVASDMQPEQMQRQKMAMEFASGRPSFDVAHLSYHVQKRLFQRGRWLADLTPFLADKNLTPVADGGEDFGEAGLLYARDGSAITSLPWSVDYFMVYWNKDLFAQKGVAFPQTIEEMISAALQLNDPANSIYGFVGRGMRNANVPLYMNLLLGFGMSALNADGALLTDTPEAIEAAKIYQTLLVNSGPPGVAGFNWMECQTLFLQGKAAMWLDGIGFSPAGENPERSRIVGKIGYGLVPKGAVSQASATFGDGLGIAAASRKKQAAYLYCQWAVSKIMGGRLLQMGAGVPFRKSVLEDPSLRATSAMPGAWLDCVAGSSRISKLGLPMIAPVAEFRDIIGAALTATLSGGDPAQEMKKATALFRPILERAERP